MSVEAITTVLHHSRATGTTKVVLIGIANHAGDGGAWPSIASLAKYARVDERTVQRSIRKLEQLGEIRVHAQSGGTRNTQDRYRPNRYDILVSCPPDCDRSMAHKCADDELEEPAEEVSEQAPEEAAIRGDADVTPQPESGVTLVSPLTLVRGDTGVAQGVTPVSPEPSLNHPDTPQPPASGGPNHKSSDSGLESPTAQLCSRHPDGGGRNCRACGTTSKQLAEQRERAAAEQARLEQQARMRAERIANEKARQQGPSPAALAELERLRQQLPTTKAGGQ